MVTTDKGVSYVVKNETNETVSRGVSGTRTKLKHGTYIVQADTKRPYDSKSVNIDGRKTTFARLNPVTTQNPEIVLGFGVQGASFSHNSMVFLDSRTGFFYKLGERLDRMKIGKVSTAAWSPDGLKAVAKDESGRLYKIDTATNEIVAYDKNQLGFFTLAITNSGEVYGATDNKVFFIMPTGSTRQITSTKNAISYLLPSANGDLAIVGYGSEGSVGAKDSISIFNLSKKQNPITKSIHLLDHDQGGGSVPLAWSPKGDRLAALDYSGNVNIYGRTLQDPVVLRSQLATNIGWIDTSRVAVAYRNNVFKIDIKTDIAVAVSNFSADVSVTSIFTSHILSTTAVYVSTTDATGQSRLYHIGAKTSPSNQLATQLAAYMPLSISDSCGANISNYQSTKLVILSSATQVEQCSQTVIARLVSYGLPSNLPVVSMSY